jgi:hypothetical protein
VGFADGGERIACDFLESGEKEIAEVMARERAFGKTIVEETAQKIIAGGEGDETLTCVTRREDAELITQNPCGTTVIRDRNDRREIDGIVLEAGEDREGARSSSHDYDLFALHIVYSLADCFKAG